MSLTAFKRKSVINYGSKRSGKPPGGYWLPQGPFGSPNSLTSVMLDDALNGPGPVGFSINGGHRSAPVNRPMRFSQQGTPYRGIYPVGYGGSGGQYYQAEPVLNAGHPKVLVRGNQWEFIKPSSLSTYGMLRQKYRWLYNGQYPQYTVKPDYGDTTLEATKSQGLYIHNKSVANDCVVDVNAEAKYVGHIVSCGPMNCKTSDPEAYPMVSQTRNAPYTKNIHMPLTSSQRTLRVQRRCIDQDDWQKPFPKGTNGNNPCIYGTCGSSRGSISNSSATATATATATANTLTIRSFTNTSGDSWTAPALTTTVEYLIVGGGGGGGGAFDTGGAGGGGAGMVITGNTSVIPGTTYTLTIGAGGAKGTAARPSETSGSDGGNSVFNGITALGGQGGNRSRSAPGGNGVGGQQANYGTSTQAGGGNGGGNVGVGNAGGGGGGNSSSGSTGNPSTGSFTLGGNGGAGITSSITGIAVTYGAGGKGGNETSASYSLAGTDGTPNTGNGGGGGGSGSSSSANGGNGADGIIVLKYYE